MELKVTNELKHFKTTPEVTGDQKKLRQAAKDFESLFTGMMLKSMTSGTGGMFGNEGLGGEVFESIFENQIASEISNGKGIGIADFIYKKLEKTYKNEASGAKSENPVELKTSPDTEVDTTIFPSKNSIRRLGKFDNIIDEASARYGIDRNLIRAVILTESGANEKATSKVKAKGLMQLMDGTAKDMGVKDVWNPKENIFGGTKYLAQMLRQYNGDLKLALASYNAGPANVEKYEGVPPFDETKNYINRVLGYLNHLNG